MSIQIVQAGTVNTAALVVPGVIVQIVPPAVSPILGTPTDVLGIVGTAAFGPTNTPVTVGSYADFVRTFGPLQARTYDLGTQVAAAVQQGAQNIRCVRVTDGTDTAAIAWINYSAGPPTTTSVNFTAIYTGSFGNRLSISLAQGSAGAGTWKLVVQLPGQQPEVFDNIPGGGSPAVGYANIVSAVNNGIGPLRGPSRLIVATPGSNTTTPIAAGGAMNGVNSGSISAPRTATDGATTITSAVMLGVDGTARSGLYALRGTNSQIVMLADVTDTTTWATQVAFAQSEGSYVVLTGPAGDTISNAISAKATAGIDAYNAKVIFGDWVLWNDTINALVRTISPQGFVAGRLANLSPNRSGLNQPMAGVVGTQKTFANLVYSQADLAQLIGAGIDVIINPSAGGQTFFSLASGHNSSSDPARRTDNYTRMVNFLAPSLAGWAGRQIGKLQTAAQRQAAYGDLDQFLGSLWQQGMIGNADGSYPNGRVPYSILLDSTNNPSNRVALGIEQADLQIQILSVIEEMLVNMEAGQSVQISRKPVTQ